MRPSVSAVSGVVSRSGRRIRSLTTWPAVIRSPLRSAAVKKTSIAEAKWAPKTSAVVVPAEASAVRNSPATASAYASSTSLDSSGSAQRSSQSSSGMPSPAITRICG